MQNSISLLTCNFNNSVLTSYMLKSFRKYSNIKCYVIDNGNEVFNNLFLLKNIIEIDNTNFKFTKNYRQPSRNHCSTIDYCIKYIIDSDYVLLCDNDILFKKNPIINDFYNFDVIGEIGCDDVKTERLFPYMCIIDVKKLKKENINYFDELRCMHYPKFILDNGKFIHTNINDFASAYDTGASFYEDIKNSWNIMKINLNDYIVHLKSNVLKNKSYNEWLKKYEYLWE